MTQNTKKRIHLIDGIALIAATVIAGICLMYGCYQIYTNGLAADSGQIYSREIIANTFATIAIPVYVCLALVIGSFILALALPMPKQKLIPEKNYPLILQRLKAKKAFTPEQADLQAAAERQQMLRRLFSIVTLALIVICAVVFLIPACQGSYWPDPTDPNETRNVNDQMAGMMPLFAACVLIPMGFGVFTFYFCRNSLRKEIELQKQAAAPAEAIKPLPRRLSEKSVTIIRCAIVAAAIAFIVFGACTGGVEAIIAKAVAICTECIGLG